MHTTLYILTTYILVSIGGGIWAASKESKEERLPIFLITLFLFIPLMIAYSIDIAFAWVKRLLFVLPLSFICIGAGAQINSLGPFKLGSSISVIDSLEKVGYKTFPGDRLYYSLKPSYLFNSTECFENGGYFDWDQWAQETTYFKTEDDVLCKTNDATGATAIRYSFQLYNINAYNKSQAELRELEAYVKKQTSKINEL